MTGQSGGDYDVFGSTAGRQTPWPAPGLPQPVFRVVNKTVDFSDYLLLSQLQSHVNDFAVDTGSFLAKS